MTSRTLNTWSYEITWNHRKWRLVKVKTETIV